MTVQHLKLLEKCGYIRLSLPLVGKDKSSEIYYSGKYSKIGFYTRKKKCILTKKNPLLLSFAGAFFANSHLENLFFFLYTCVTPQVRK